MTTQNTPTFEDLVFGTMTIHWPDAGAMEIPFASIDFDNGYSVWVHKSSDEMYVCKLVPKSQSETISTKFLYSFVYPGFWEQDGEVICATRECVTKFLQRVSKLTSYDAEPDEVSLEPSSVLGS
jgi:hypothetical protein